MIKQRMFLIKKDEAVRAVLLFLKNYGESATFEQIDRVVFYDMSDLDMLERLLTEMDLGGLIDEDNNGYFRVTTIGKNFLEANHVSNLD